MHIGFFLTGKKKKKKKKPVGFFPLDLFGHSRSRIVHCAGPHPQCVCVIVVASIFMVVYIQLC